MATNKVGESHYHQAEDGDEDAEPLTGCEPTTQKSYRQETGEDDDGAAKHLKTGGARHVES